MANAAKWHQPQAVCAAGFWMKAGRSSELASRWQSVHHAASGISRDDGHGYSRVAEHTGSSHSNCYLLTCQFGSRY